MAYSQTPFSGAANGQPVLVAATADPGTVVHTAQAGANFLDEVQLTAWNNSASDVLLTLEWGGNATANLVKVTVPANSYITLAPVFLQNGLVLKAFAASANVIILTGRVIVGG